MSIHYLEPTQEAGANLFSRNMEGEIYMLNLLRFKQVADYTAHPHLAPQQAISGRLAFNSYIKHTIPFLEESGGEWRRDCIYGDM